MAQLEALIFDVDGTLADTERDGHRPAFNQAFEEAGLSWRWSVADYAELLTVTGGKERIAYFMQRHLPEFKPPGDVQAFIADLHRRKTAHYLRLLREGHIPLRPGVKRLLDEARAAGLRLAIATTTTPENVSQLLEATLGRESIAWFEVIGAGDVVPAKKPAPDIFVYALEKLGLDAAVCMAFEDSQNGLLSAHGAGLSTIVTTNDYTQAQDFQAAVLVVDQFGEPDQPFTLQRGEAQGAQYVDIALIRRLLAA